MVDYHSMDIDEDQWRRFGDGRVGLASDSRFKVRSFNDKPLRSKVEFFNERSKYDLDPEEVRSIVAHTDSAGQGGMFVMVYFGDVKTTETDLDQGSEVDVNELYYSTRIGSGWVGLDAAMNVVTDTYGTHKELKADHDVEGVQGFKEVEFQGEEQKVYSLAIHPDNR